VPRTHSRESPLDLVMIAPPYALPLTYDECFGHYRLVDDSIDDLQVMVYNYPYLPRGLDMTYQFWKERLLGLDSIKALKESTLSHDKLIFTIKDWINVFSGNENSSSMILLWGPEESCRSSRWSRRSWCSSFTMPA
jgi:dihydrodipicolinate synthase/N-acetylneuraminate lyase